MPSTNRAVFDLLIAVIGVLVLSWRAATLWRNPLHRSLWLVTACIAAAEVEYVLALPGVAATADDTVGAGTAKLLQNLALFLFSFLLVCFFLDSAGEPTKRIRKEAALYLAMSAALVVVAFAIPPMLRGTPYSPTLDSGWLRTFYLLTSTYIGYTLLIALRVAWRYSRISRQPLALGLVIISVSLAGKLAGGPLTRISSILAGWVGIPLPETLATVGYDVLMISIVIFMVGVVYPTVVDRVLAVGRWRRDHRTYRRLEPLWTALNEAFPHGALHRVPLSRVRRLLTQHSAHRLRYRRAIECRDGLVQISPYLPRDDLTSPGPVQPHEQAANLRIALRARADQRPPQGGVMLVAPPRRPGFDADVAELVALSQALAAHDKQCAGQG